MTYIPYAKHTVLHEDVSQVIDSLYLDRLTGGTKTKLFELSLKSVASRNFAVAMNSGTAALHAAMYAIGIGAGDEVLVPSISFMATANCVEYTGGKPVFVDICRDTMLIDMEDAKKKISSRTKAIITMDYAGQLVDYCGVRDFCKENNIVFVSDACHSFGEFRGTGGADILCYSFHPAKNITTGEGGALLTDNEEFYNRAKRFMSHNMTSGELDRRISGSHDYDMVDLGFNYRITEMQAALGLSQIARIKSNMEKRRETSWAYDILITSRNCGVCPLHVAGHSGNHLYVVRVDDNIDRDKVFKYMISKDIGVNVHYKPIHMLSYYKNKYGVNESCPTAEYMYNRVISLPMFADMDNTDIQRVINCLIHGYKCGFEGGNNEQ